MTKLPEKQTKWHLIKIGFITKSDAGIFWIAETILMSTHNKVYEVILVSTHNVFMENCGYSLEFVGTH